MGILLTALIFIGILFALMALFGFTQPRIARLERSVLINADAATVYPEVSNLKRFVIWSPWSEKDPDMQQTFSGEDGTIGSSYNWNGNNKVGQGSMVIAAITPEKDSTMNIDFGNRGKAQCSFVVEPTGQQTKVTWKFESDMGNNPIMRCAQPMMRKFIGKDYERGLNNLKKHIEG